MEYDRCTNKLKPSFLVEWKENITMGKYMDNPSLDVMITAIVSKEIEEYKSKILNGIEKHFNNPYCAATDIGKVMYEKEIKALINRIEI